MPRLRILAALIGCFLALSPLAKGLGATKEANYCATPPHPPAGLAMTLSLKNGQTTFRVGEIITLVTGYTSLDSDKYIWNSKSYDRIGRNFMESFCIEPNAGRDPLRDYFNAQTIMDTGGLESSLQLGQDPQIAELDLNEWMALPPGTYRLSVVGYRVSVGKEGDFHSWNGKSIPIRSNTVDFTVIEADPAWRTAQIEASAEVLNKAKHGPIDDDARVRAKRVLRFLGTRESEHQIAVRFAESPKGDENWQYTAGLWASTDRAAVLDEMKAVLRSHHQGVNEHFVWELAEMEMYSEPKWRSVLAHQSDDFSRFWNDYAAELNRRVDTYLAEVGMKREVTSGPVKKSRLGMSGGSSLFRN
jgi:hypothetical protein